MADTATDYDDLAITQGWADGTTALVLVIHKGKIIVVSQRVSWFKTGAVCFFFFFTFFFFFYTPPSLHPANRVFINCCTTPVPRHLPTSQTLG